MATLQYVTFELDGNLFGINILLVREINKHVAITRVDAAPDFMSGLLNLRGQIVNVIDLGVRLGFSPRTITERTRIIVLKTTHETSKTNLSDIIEDNTASDIVGFLVDKIGDVVSVEVKDIEPAPANIGGIDSEYFKGVYKMKHALLPLLKVSKVLALEKSQPVAAGIGSNL
jgi:purine-binding chemotaxis protein CheW